ATVAVILAGVALAARALGATTGLAVFVPAFVALIPASALAVGSAPGGDVRLLIVAYGVTALGALWAAVPAARRRPEAAAIVALAPPALTIGILSTGELFRGGEGGILAWWWVAAVAALVVLAAAAAVL